MIPNEKGQEFYESAIRKVELPLFAELRGCLGLLPFVVRMCACACHLHFTYRLPFIFDALNTNGNHCHFQWKLLCRYALPARIATHNKQRESSWSVFLIGRRCLSPSRGSASCISQCEESKGSFI